MKRLLIGGSIIILLISFLIVYIIVYIIKTKKIKEHIGINDLVYRPLANYKQSSIEQQTLLREKRIINDFHKGLDVSDTSTDNRHQQYEIDSSTGQMTINPNYEPNYEPNYNQGKIGTSNRDFPIGSQSTPNNKNTTTIQSIGSEKGTDILTTMKAGKPQQFNTANLDVNNNNQHNSNLQKNMLEKMFSQLQGSTLTKEDKQKEVSKLLASGDLTFSSAKVKTYSFDLITGDYDSIKENKEAFKNTIHTELASILKLPTVDIIIDKESIKEGSIKFSAVIKNISTEDVTRKISSFEKAVGVYLLPGGVAVDDSPSESWENIITGKNKDGTDAVPIRTFDKQPITEANIANRFEKGATPNTSSAATAGVSAAKCPTPTLNNSITSNIKNDTLTLSCTTPNYELTWGTPSTLTKKEGFSNMFPNIISNVFDPVKSLQGYTNSYRGWAQKQKNIEHMAPKSVAAQAKAAAPAAAASTMAFDCIEGQWKDAQQTLTEYINLRCTPKTCTVDAIINGTQTSKEPINYGETVTYACKTGYTPHSDHVSFLEQKCRGDAIIAPTCEPRAPCSVQKVWKYAIRGLRETDGPVPKDVKGIPVTGNEVPHGTVVKYTCDDKVPSHLTPQIGEGAGGTVDGDVVTHTCADGNAITAPINCTPNDIGVAAKFESNRLACVESRAAIADCKDDRDFQKNKISCKRLPGVPRWGLGLVSASDPTAGSYKISCGSEKNFDKRCTALADTLKSSKTGVAWPPGGTWWHLAPALNGVQWDAVNKKWTGNNDTYVFGQSHNTKVIDIFPAEHACRNPLPKNETCVNKHENGYGVCGFKKYDNFHSA